MNTNPSVRPFEWRWTIIISLLLISFSSIPIAVGYLSQTSDLQFSGAVFDRQDYEVHIGTMQLGVRGQWTYELLFTHEGHEPKPVKLAYIILGQISNWTGVESRILFEIARLIFGLSLLLALYRFIALIDQRVSLRRVAFMISAAGSGFGWLYLLFGKVSLAGGPPLDFSLIDAYVFFSILSFPHFTFVGFMILLMSIHFERYLSTGELRRVFLVTALGVLIVPVSPFSVAIADLLLGSLLLASWIGKGEIQWSDSFALFGIVLFQIPCLALNYSVFGEPIWVDMAEQNILLSPSLWVYIVGFGVMAPLALQGAYLAWRKKNIAGITASIWVLGAFVLAYNPTSFQRRFFLLISIPLGLLSAIALVDGIYPSLERWKSGLRRSSKLIRRLRLDWGLTVVLIPLTFGSTLYLVAGGAFFASQHPEDLFDNTAYLQAISWIGRNASTEDVVLASPRGSLPIPGITGLHVYVGHQIETINFYEKLETAVSFFRPDGLKGDERSELLSTCHCNWVIFSEYEKVYGYDAFPVTDSMDLVYDREGVQVFQVR